MHSWHIFEYVYHEILAHISHLVCDPFCENVPKVEKTNNECVRELYIFLFCYKVRSRSKSTLGCNIIESCEYSVE